MGALHAGHVALFRGRARRVRRRRRERLRQPGAVRRAGRPRRVPARPRRATQRVAADARRRRPLRAVGRRALPARLRDLGRARRRRRGARGRAPARPLPRRRDRLPEAVQHRPPAASPTSAARTRSRSRSSSRSSATSTSSSRSASSRPCATPTGSRSRRATRRLSAAERARALAIPRALATRDPTRARAVLAEAGIEPDYVAVADLDGPTLAIAARVGATRLIDNVLLEGEPAMSTRPRTPGPSTPAPGKLPLPELARDEAPRRQDRDGHRLRRARPRGSPTRPASS